MSNGNPGVNQALDHLHDMLIARHKQLNDSLDTITDPAIAQAVVTEMGEVLHRIDGVQRQLFKAASQMITDKVAAVDAANADLVRSLQTISNITKLVKAVSDFLTLVDAAIDLAKTL
jgi:hypothetical protein